MNYMEKIQRNTNDIYIIPSEEEELFRKKFKDLDPNKKCTICGKIPIDFQVHPALRVIVCNECYQFYDNTVFLSSKDGTDKNCRWCGNKTTNYCCSNCTVVFCPDCLTRNFGSNYITKNNPEWNCLICDPKQLWSLRAQCAKALESESPKIKPDTTNSTVITNSSIIELNNKNLTPEIIREARTIFEPSKRNFNRLIEKIQINSKIFSAVTANKELRTAQDVHELTKRVSCMCECIQDVITWIDECNKTNYNKWLNKFIVEKPDKSPLTPQNTQTSDESIDLLNTHKHQESRKIKTKEILQSLRLKKVKHESAANSVVSENFMNFLDGVKVEISELKKDESPAKIKSEPLHTKSSVFSNQTQVIINPTKKNESKTGSLTQTGILELQSRIQNDFDETETNIELRTIQYLCDKTGDLFEGLEVSNSGQDTPIVVFHEGPDSSIDFEEKSMFSNISDKNMHQDNREMLNYSPGLIKLLNNDFSHTNNNNNLLEQESSDEDPELKNVVEQEKELIYKTLVDSDLSNSSLSSSISSSSSSSASEVEVMNEETRGHIQLLNIENELHKLTNNFVKENVEEEKPKLDEKFTQKCEVSLEQMDFNAQKNLKKIRGTLYGYKILHPDASLNSESENENDEDKEIDKLLNLNSLYKRKRSIDSDDDDDDDDDNDNGDINKKKQKKITKYTSKENCDTASESSNNNSDTDVSSDDILSMYSPKAASNDEEKENILTNGLSDLCNSISSGSDTEDTDDENIKNKKKYKKTEENKKYDVPGWKKDALLTGRLSVGSDTNTNTNKNNKKKDVSDEVLQQQEEKFLEKSTKQLMNFDDAIVLSDTESESDSDSDFGEYIKNISKRKKLSESEDNDDDSPHKKGRKNIKKVLDDSELQEETQIADQEEERRKERISLKHRSLDAVLSQSTLSQDDIGMVLDVDEINKTPLVKIPQILINPLKPHQINGIKFMWDICFESITQIEKTQGAGCILAHCMGLGKTMQVVVLAYTLLTHPLTKVRNVLIICPLSTVFNWCNEFRETLKHAPETINIFDIRSDRHRLFRDRIFEVKKWQEKGGVLIMGYDSFTALVDEKKLNDKVTDTYRKIVLKSLINPGPDFVVCDEGHILKSCKTHKFKALNRIRTKRRILLTGTPLQNNLMEYWHMVSFVKPHLLGTYKEYTNRFVNPIMNGQYEDSSPTDIQLMKKRSHVLHKKLQTTVHRYELSELKQYLPSKHEYVLFLKLSDLQIKLYESYLEKIKYTGKTRNLFKNFHDLQKIWTHPALLHRKYEAKKTYDEDFDPNLDPDTVNSQNILGEAWYKDLIPSDISTNITYGPKMIILFSIIKESCAIGEKVLVFSSSIAELDLIEEFLKNNAIQNGQSWLKNSDYYRMDGSVLPEQRMRYCNAFNDPKNKSARLFLISHKVGGLGLNLIEASRVVLMDVNWNPAYDTQSVFRCYRFGQKKSCFIYRLVSLGTMEELVYSRAVTKLAISCRVVDEQQIRRHFKEDDQHKLYKLNTEYLRQEPVTPNVPTDRLLANLWGTHRPILYNFKDHQSMLENLAHEELNEEEMKMAWDEFKREEETEKLRIEHAEKIKEFFNQQCLTQLGSGANPNAQPVTVYQPVNKYPQEMFTNLINLAYPSTSSVTTTPRPVGLISRKRKQNLMDQTIKPNPFNSQFQNEIENIEMILPDAGNLGETFVNNVLAHSNNHNHKNLPSTSAHVPMPYGNKQIYNNPNLGFTYMNKNASTSYVPKKIPKLLPVHQSNINNNQKSMGKNETKRHTTNSKENTNNDDVIHLD